MQADQRHLQTRKVTLTGAFVNCILAFSQIVFGLLGHSQALFADGLHTLSDLTSDFIVLVAARQSARAADANHPYGHGRIETLASVILAVILISVGISIGYRGILSIVFPVQTNPEWITVIFAGLAIVAKESLYRYTLRVAHQIHSALLESNAWHHRSDALSSVVVLVGISAQLSGIPHMDAVAAIVVAVMVVFIGIKLGRKAVFELIDTGLDMDLVNQIKQQMMEHAGAKAIHSLRTRSMGGLGYIDAEIRVDPRLTVSEAHYIAYRIERNIKAKFPQIIDVSLHIDPLTESSHAAVKNLPTRQELLGLLNQVWHEIPVSKKIQRIQLHYLDTQIEIDIIFPRDSNNTELSIEYDKLATAAESIPDIGIVALYFTR